MEMVNSGDDGVGRGKSANDARRQTKEGVGDDKHENMRTTLHQDERVWG